MVGVRGRCRGVCDTPGMLSSMIMVSGRMRYARHARAASPSLLPARRVGGDIAADAIEGRCISDDMLVVVALPERRAGPSHHRALEATHDRPIVRAGERSEELASARAAPPS
jgi:hypothetical protein